MARPIAASNSRQPRTTPRVQRQKSLATRAALIAAARHRFGEAGYHATGTGDVVERASLTRGALYHHFEDKEALFAAVARQVAQELSDATQDTSRQLVGNGWDRLLAGFHIYLQLASENEASQRILLIDGPAVLGWQRWRDVQSEIIFPRLATFLGMLMDQGELRRRKPDPLARLLLAALNDAALTIAYAEDPRLALAEVGAALVAILEGLRQPK